MKTRGYSARNAERPPSPRSWARPRSLGGAVAAGLVSVLDRDDRQSSETVVVSVPVATETIDGTTSQVAPVLGNRFDPAAIYAARAGVVTIYAEISGSQSQGSGFVVDETRTVSPTRT